jgi:hypothetical protein
LSARNRTGVQKLRTAITVIQEIVTSTTTLLVSLALPLRVREWKNVLARKPASARQSAGHTPAVTTGVLTPRGQNLKYARFALTVITLLTLTLALEHALALAVTVPTVTAGLERLVIMELNALRAVGVEALQRLTVLQEILTAREGRTTITVITTWRAVEAGLLALTTPLLEVKLRVALVLAGIVMAVTAGPALLVTGEWTAVQVGGVMTVLPQQTLRALPETLTVPAGTLVTGEWTAATLE